MGMMYERKKLVTTGAMARLLGVPVRWLKAEVEAGRIPAVKADRVFLFNPDIVVELLAERARGAANEH